MAIAQESEIRAEQAQTSLKVEATFIRPGLVIPSVPLQLMRPDLPVAQTPDYLLLHAPAKEGEMVRLYENRISRLPLNERAAALEQSLSLMAQMNQVEAQLKKLDNNTARFAQGRDVRAQNAKDQRAQRKALQQRYDSLRQQWVNHDFEAIAEKHVNVGYDVNGAQISLWANQTITDRENGVVPQTTIEPKEPINSAEALEKYEQILFAATTVYAGGRKLKRDAERAKLLKKYAVPSGILAALFGIGYVTVPQVREGLSAFIRPVAAVEPAQSQGTNHMQPTEIALGGGGGTPEPTNTVIPQPTGPTSPPVVEVKTATPTFTATSSPTIENTTTPTQTIQATRTAEYTATIAATATTPPTKEPTKVAELSEKEIIKNYVEHIGQSSIKQYADAYGFSSEEVTARLEGDGALFTITSGNQNLDILIDPQTGVPLFFKDNSLESSFNNIGIKDLANRLHNINTGTSFVGWLIDNGNFYNIIKNNFNDLTITWGILWNEAEPQEGNFTTHDAGQQFLKLRTHGITGKNIVFKGHALVFPQYDPDWLSQKTPAELDSILENHIKEMITAYQGNISQWVVVNEPFSRNGKVDALQNALGNDYVYKAFEYARKYGPNTKLIYNDTLNHTSNGATTNQTKEIVSRLKQLGLVDAVGLQMHIVASDGIINTQDIISTMKGYNLPVKITELDVDLTGINGTDDELRRFGIDPNLVSPKADKRALIQAKIYSDVVGACIGSGVCQEINFWEIGDQYSWLEKSQNRPNADATLYTDQLQPKASYYEVLKAFLENLAD